MNAFATQTTINAPAETIWRILTDAPAYPEWNTTVTAIEGRIAPGATVTVHAKVSPGRAFPVKVATFDVPRRMVWTSGLPLGLFKGERTYQLRDAGPNAVDFTMREEYTGLMAGFIFKSIPDLQPAFAEFAACLKSLAEQQ